MGGGEWRKRSLPVSDMFYLRHSEHQAHLWQGETGRWSSAMVLFLIASKLISTKCYINHTYFHTNPNNVQKKRTDELDVRKEIIGDTWTHHLSCQKGSRLLLTLLRVGLKGFRSFLLDSSNPAVPFLQDQGIFKTSLLCFQVW